MAKQMNPVTFYSDKPFAFAGGLVKKDFTPADFSKKDDDAADDVVTDADDDATDDTPDAATDDTDAPVAEDDADEVLSL